MSATGGKLPTPWTRVLRDRLGTQEGIVVLVIVILFAAFATFMPEFRSTQNLLGLVRNVSVLGILSLGMAIVVIGRGMDLSIVAVMAVSMTLSVVLANQGWSFSSALVVGLGASTLVGAIVGFLVAVVEIPAIFATLALSAIVYGVGRGFIAALDVNNLPNGVDWFRFIGRGALAGIPVTIWVFGLAALAV